jgi:hypothetical protein
MTIRARLTLTASAVALLASCTGTPEPGGASTTPTEAVSDNASVGSSTTAAVTTDTSSAPLMSVPVPEDNQGTDWWHLVDVVDASPGQRLTVVTDTFSLTAVWDTLGNDSPAPGFDWDRQVVFVFESFKGVDEKSDPDRGCDELWLEDLVVAAGVVYPNLATLELPCVAMGSPRTFLVAVDRGRLPEVPFELRSFERDRNGIQVTAGMLTTP